MTAGHALLSASASHRWLNCCPSARLELEFAEHSTEAAAEGTAAHALAEHKLRRALKLRSRKPVSPYVKPRIEVNRFGSNSVIYEGVGTTKKWERIESYGPKFVENIVQAISRDILVEAVRRLNTAGYEIVMHVHDEVVIEAPSRAEPEPVCQLMAETPPWSAGLILRAEGYVCDFYRKG